MNVYIQGCAATPNLLVDAMARYGKKANLSNVKVYHIHTEGPATYTQEEYAGWLVYFDFPNFVSEN